jgi:AcrR family transcriptional regulator
MTTRNADGLENWRKGVRKKKRDDILSAALELFRKRGYHDTSVVALSELAGASTATIYKHFSSKEEIFAACVETQL